MEHNPQIYQDRKAAVASARQWSKHSGMSAIGVYLAVILLAVLSLFLTFMALDIQSAARAYVAGESEWSKSQKEVVYWLDRAADTGESVWLKQSRDALQVPLSDLKARLAMEQQPPDSEAAIQFFIAAGNHPADSAKMARLFRYFHNAPYIRDAIGHWRDSDVYILRLQAIIGEIETQFKAVSADKAQINRLRMEVGLIAKELRPIQTAFSAALGQASRSLNLWLKSVAIIAIVILAVFIGFIFRWATVRIADSERQFRDTFEQAAMGMAQMHPDGTLIAVNHALCDLLSYPVNDLVGRSLLELQHPDHGPDSIRELLAVSGTPKSQEHRLITRDGVAIWCRLSLSHVEDTWRSRHHMILGVLDVTETRDLLHKLHYQCAP